MANFPSIEPDYGIAKINAPNVKVIQFGDGYEQRITVGNSQNLKAYTVSFKHLTEADSDTIEAFLDARALDNESFTWTPPGESSASKFVCTNWTKTIYFANRATIQTRFREVAEP